MDENSVLMQFIAQKREFEANGWKVFWIFEANFINNLKEIYGKKMVSLEERLDNPDLNATKLGNFLMCGLVKKKFDHRVSGVKIIHLGSLEGFSREDIVLIDDENSDDTNSVKCQRFNDAVKKIIGNREMVPDQSIILMTQEKHHQKKSRTKNYLKENHKTSNMKKREKTSQLRGQRTIPDFFVKKKSTTDTLPYKNLEFPLQSTHLIEVEEITTKLRGDQVKILWMPKRHSELDASQYISVFLLNEIARLIEDDTIEEIDLKEKCGNAIDYFPNEVWRKASTWVQSCEDFHLNKDVEDFAVNIKKEKLDQTEIDTEDEN